jgi:hypothetical protein
MASQKIKIAGELLDQAKRCAETAGYSSVDEFVMHTVEKEVNRLLGQNQEAAPDSKELVKKRLQGLGYIE